MQKAPAVDNCFHKKKRLRFQRIIPTKLSQRNTCSSIALYTRKPRQSPAYARQSRPNKKLSLCMLIFYVPRQRVPSVASSRRLTLSFPYRQAASSPVRRAIYVIAGGFIVFLLRVFLLD